MDRSLTYNHHLESLKMKVASRVALIRKMAGTTWGADAAMLRISNNNNNNDDDELNARSVQIKTSGASLPCNQVICKKEAKWDIHGREKCPL